MPEKPEDYLAKAREDAIDTIEHFKDEIIRQVVENKKASDDMGNDYPGGDSYHHSYHVDKSYDLIEAAHLLDQLANYEETDGGLWQGLEPREAVKAQAAYTYGNAVNGIFGELIQEFNQELEDEGDWGATGPKDWTPNTRPPHTWIKRVLGQMIKKWR